MKYGVEVACCLALFCILGGIAWCLGINAFAISLGVAVLWFGITFALISKPPGVPNFHFDPTKDLTEQDFMSRQDPFKPVAVQARLRVSLSVSCLAVGTLWYLLLA